MLKKELVFNKKISNKYKYNKLKLLKKVGFIWNLKLITLILILIILMETSLKNNKYKNKNNFLMKNNDFILY
jgi:hypothetical protein